MKRVLQPAALASAILIAMSANAQGNLTELSAAEAASLIRAGKLKSEDLVKALADTIDNKKDLNAFIAFDREAALKAARESDALAARKKFKGPLHGRAAGREGQHSRRRLCEHCRNAGTKGLQAEIQRASRRQADSGRCHRARQDQHARARVRYHDQQRRVRRGAQSVRSQADRGRILGRHR
jgi:hypothetical protein